MAFFSLNSSITALLNDLSNVFSQIESFLQAHPIVASVLTGFITSTLTVLLNQKAADDREQKTDRKRRERIRKTLESEIEQNLRSLERLQDTLLNFLETIPKAGLPAPLSISISDYLEQKEFDKQKLSLHEILNKNEIQGIRKFYDDLKIFGLDYSKLLERSLKNKQIAKSCLETSRSILRAGNPLRRRKRRLKVEHLKAILR